VRWGDDLDQLTVRYGAPASRAQVRGNRAFEASGFVEYYDTAQRAYSPERWLSDGFPQPPLPGEPPPLYATRSRSGYALRTVHRVLDLPHQLTRFVAGDDVVLRVDAVLHGRRPQPATARRSASASSPTTRRSPGGCRRRDAPVGGRFAALLADRSRCRPGDLIYSVEALDSACRLRGTRSLLTAGTGAAR
jgi:hypothetical protein